MKPKLKKFINSKLFIFIITALVFSTIGVSAATLFPSNNVTYDNSASGLNSNNVQGAIDELYNTCFLDTVGDSILDNVDIVTTGDGLYEDLYEEGKYTYKGANPNNYITYNNETWRIVSIEADKTLKIMREASIGTMAWDTSNNNNWSRPSSLNTYLNGTYLTGILNQAAQNQIVSKKWSIGEITFRNNDLADQINDEKSSRWNGKVALVTVSDYLRSNSNQSSCGTHSLNQSNYSSCKNTTWMQNSSINFWRILTPYPGFYSFIVSSSGDVRHGPVNDSYEIRPSVFLSSKVKMTGGDGSQANPYTIK